MTTDTDRYVQNILRTYARATDTDCERGMSWYPEAQGIATDMSPTDPLRAAGVLAIFSARTPWNRNVMLARNLFLTGIAPGHIFTEHAQRMHDGEPVMEVLKGDKTRAFANTIANGGVWDVTTIDGHAYDIADGKVWGKDRPNIGKTVYRAMDEAYHIAATVMAFEYVTQLQAITWVTHRRELGYDWRG
jgi:hypothetical protein